MLTRGTKLGPYEIIALLGAGSMGEVYRARDARLARDVAIKVLPASLSQDLERLHRFEQEARAAAALNHPNILAIHDFGRDDGAPYVVSELLEGETLRARISRGPIPGRKAIHYAQQIARGLAAAHEKGIIHRDVKPENLFLLKDDQVKILDFGLAKLTQPEMPAVANGQSAAPTIASGTGAGMAVGTVGYMAPEQVRGLYADQRSDLFSLGAVLYEMLSGKRAFQGNTAADTITAILIKDPPDLTGMANLPLGLERIVQHCLEKQPQSRFQSGYDVAFDLDALVSASGSAVAPVAAERIRLRWHFLGIGAVCVLSVIAAFVLGKACSRLPPATFEQLTFRRGTITGARFTPDGQSIVFDGRWGGQPPEIFTTTPQGRELRPLELHHADILAVSPNAELAILLDRRFGQGFDSLGKLARVPSSGGAPREILDDVQDADWSPDGSAIAIIHELNNKYRLEYPPGRVLYETDFWISHLRFSPNGDHIAFVDHPIWGDDRGKVLLVDFKGKVTRLTDNFGSMQGLAWSPSGKEVWFTAAQTGNQRILRAVDLAGRQRVLFSGPGALQLEDVAQDGRILLTYNNVSRVLMGRAPGASGERELSWFDWPLARALSADGKWVLFEEEGTGGGPGYSIYLRSTGGAPAIRLGEGLAFDLSRDGKWVLSIPLRSPPQQIVLLPTGVGEPRQLTNDSIDHQWALWLPDGKSFAFAGIEPGHAIRWYVQGIEGPPRTVTPEGFTCYILSNDGKSLLCRDPNGNGWSYPLYGGFPVAVSGLARADTPDGWSPDGKFIYVHASGELPAKMYRVELSSGHRQLVKTFAPSDPSGASRGIFEILLSSDAQSYVYGYTRWSSELYLVRGIR